MLAAVVDPGVLIAALLSPTGSPAQLFRFAIEGRYEIVASPLLVNELRAVLRRPKFRRYCDLEEADRFVSAVERLAHLVADPPPSSRRGPDPGDDYLLALAAPGRVLVSGDKALLSFARPPLPILSPSAFVDLLERAAP